MVVYYFQEELISLRLKRDPRLAAQWSLILKSWIKSCLVASQLQTSLMVTPLIAMSATQGKKHGTCFDTDSVPVGIDNRCSACITNCIDDFVAPPKPTNRCITGFGGLKMANIRIGTIQWKWEDDKGVIHTHLIPNSYYAPEAKVRLLSPQHWMQTLQSHHASTASCTSADHIP
jgi:hypothetical protein